MLIQTQLSQYHREAYAVLRQFFSRDELSRMLSEIERISRGSTLAQHDNSRLEALHPLSILNRQRGLLRKTAGNQDDRSISVRRVIGISDSVTALRPSLPGWSRNDCR